MTQFYCPNCICHMCAKIRNDHLPVAWRVQVGDEWVIFHDEEKARFLAAALSKEVEALYLGNDRLDIGVG